MIESERSVAFAVIDKIVDDFEKVDWKAPLKLCGSYEHDTEGLFSIATNVERELIYNIEHAIHHMALIKVGLKTLRPEVVVSSSFGVASSTIRYEKSKAQ